MVKKGWGGFTNGRDEVKIKEAADPVNTGDDGDWLFRKVEDLLSELFGLASGVLGGHDGEEGETRWVRVERILDFIGK